MSHFEHCISIISQSGDIRSRLSQHVYMCLVTNNWYYEYKNYINRRNFLRRNIDVITDNVSSSSVNNAFAKTTHDYCYVAWVFAGSSLVGDHGDCFKTLSECQVAQNTVVREGLGSYSAKITKECFKSTNSDKSTNNYCWDLRPTGDGKECYGSKKECESGREKFKAGKNWYRVGTECYKIS